MLRQVICIGHVEGAGGACAGPTKAASLCKKYGVHLIDQGIKRHNGLLRWLACDSRGVRLHPYMEQVAATLRFGLANGMGYVAPGRSRGSGRCL